jgi:hypothetical protein
MTLHRRTTWDDVYYVSDNMREGDVEDCWAGGLSAYDALARSFENSTVAYTLFEPDSLVPAAVLGVSESPFDPSFGTIWMLGTDGIRKHRYRFLRNCKPFLKDLYEETGKQALYNYTYAGNTLHHAWLRWLGFTILREVELPPYGYPFYEFVGLKG